MPESNEDVEAANTPDSPLNESAEKSSIIVGGLGAGLGAGFGVKFWLCQVAPSDDEDPNCTFSKAAVAADSEKCSKIGLTEWTVEWKEDSRWIGVPGEIRGYEVAHRLYGKLPWADLFQPAIKLAREGFPIPYYQGQHIPRINNTSIRKLYLDKNGNLLKTGDTVKFEKLADTLEMIANEGPDVFYNGPIAKNLTSDIQDAGGNLTKEDLASYQANVTDAWNISLGDYRMYFPPPPAGGAILSFILNIMKGS
ncbi:glutathione hydrolase 5 proenzyme-like [Neolamprologus brichardi]|uniref:glutathione hydrolase 5 proenzyme-like n=1 Tax=Neolamprologus brichardi TaxID=32507 RepID=UPI0016436CE4|nr:glutathione hydrolase 5 proenzyme-like [Neolamprologus brichardi]